MSNSEVELGPIDYLVVEWPPDKQPNGEALPMLVDLVDRGLIRVLDLAFVRKEQDGTVVGLDLASLDLEANPELTVFEGASSGLLGDDDFNEAGNALEPGSSAALLIYENTWAAPFATALRRSGAQLVANGRIPVNAIIAALDEMEQAEAEDPRRMTHVVPGRNRRPARASTSVELLRLRRVPRAGDRRGVLLESHGEASACRGRRGDADRRDGKGVVAARSKRPDRAGR